MSDPRYDDDPLYLGTKAMQEQERVRMEAIEATTRGIGMDPESPPQAEASSPILGDPEKPKWPWKAIHARISIAQLMEEKVARAEQAMHLALLRQIFQPAWRSAAGMALDGGTSSRRGEWQPVRWIGPVAM